MDQQSLKYLLEQRITTPAQARWFPKLLWYDYHIEYKKGSKNKVANSLSRLELSFLTISKPQVDWWQHLQQKYSCDPFYQNLATASNVVQRDGVRFLNGKVLLKPTYDLINLF